MSDTHAFDMLISIWSFCEPEDRDAFVSYLRVAGFIPSSNPEQADVDRSALRASSAVEVGATNSPERAQGIPSSSHEQRHELVAGPVDQSDKEPLVAAGAVASVSATNCQSVGASSPPSEPAVRSSDESTRTNSVTPPPPGETDKAEAVPPPAVSAAPIKTLSKADRIRQMRPGCIHADNLELCGGQGKVLCQGCKKAVAEGDAA